MAFCQRNYLAYYVGRNAAVLRYLARQPWVEARDITAMGHSEGAPIVARLARISPHLRRVIYLNGSSLGRMLTMLPSSDMTGDTTGNAAAFGRWQGIVAAPRAYDCTQPGDSPLTTASLSERQTPIEDFRRCRLPVFVGYGSRDHAAISNDYLHLEMLRAGKRNFTFRVYPGLEHSFFGFSNGQVDYEKEHWDEVTSDFFRGCKRTRLPRPAWGRVALFTDERGAQTLTNATFCRGFFRYPGAPEPGGHRAGR